MYRISQTGVVEETQLTGGVANAGGVTRMGRPSRR
jgi:hypothetical protein